MYNKCKTLGKGKSSVTTSMIWGTLWDETLDWFVKSNAVLNDGTKMSDYNLVGMDSFKWGNYKNSNTFEYYTDLSSKVYKNSGSSVRIPTGSADFTKVNNIYDMAGNVFDWTLESSKADNAGTLVDVRICRGGNYDLTFSAYPAGARDTAIATGSNELFGCRALLLIN